MDIAERAKFIAKYTVATITGDMVRRLLVVMALTELNEAEAYQKLSRDCEALLNSIEIDPIVAFIAPGTMLLNRYKELNDGISIEEA